MTSILLPTDFSACANNALAYATALAMQHNATLYLLHTYDIPLMAPAGMFSTREATMQHTETELREMARQRMAALVKEHALEQHPHRCLIREGSVVNTIVEEAKNHHCDLVVMGTQGESSFENLLMGSVTNAVIRNSPARCSPFPNKPTIYPLPALCMQLR